MRVAFCGSSGTGKSTLATKLIEPSLPFNPVGSRWMSREMGFKSPYDVDAVGKRAEFQHRLQASKIEWELRHEAFVTDRTVFDELAYTTIHDVKAVDPGYFRSAIVHMDRYTHIIYCPVQVFCKTGTDPQRVHDMTYQYLFDAMLRGLLASFPPRHFLTLRSNKLVERVNEVRSYLESP